jgi:hypothetical protein
MKPLGVLAVLVLASGIPIYRAVHAACRLAPGRRPWLIAGAIAALGLVAALVPWVWELSPTLRESPGGLFVIIGKATALGLLAVGALATLLGAALPPRR